MDEEGRWEERNKTNFFFFRESVLNSAIYPEVADSMRRAILPDNRPKEVKDLEKVPGYCEFCE